MSSGWVQGGGSRWPGAPAPAGPSFPSAAGSSAADRGGLAEAAPTGTAPDEGRWLVALLGLPGMGPARLRAQLDGRQPGEAWEALVAGVGRSRSELVARWVDAARATDVDRRWAEHLEAGIQVLRSGDQGWPAALLDDPEPPVVLFARGEPLVLRRPTVAIVGTRRCTSAGRAVAAELGLELAAAGVCVVSGLALGIDGAAHRGALDAGGAPVAVVGTGLDVVYPSRHRSLWAEVAGQGAILSEYPLGTPPERWRFPARNRIIAALASVVVVVESHAGGGSLHTVEAALERDRLVTAVPGPVRSPASVGTNGLLVAGATPVRDATDVLVALGLRAAADARRVVVELPPGDAGLVLEAVGWVPTSLEEIAERCDAPLGPVAVHLADLERGGWITNGSGWYERVR